MVSNKNIIIKIKRLEINWLKLYNNKNKKNTSLTLKHFFIRFNFHYIHTRSSENDELRNT